MGQKRRKKYNIITGAKPKANADYIGRPNGHRIAAVCLLWTRRKTSSCSDKLNFKTSEISRRVECCELLSKDRREYACCGDVVSRLSLTSLLTCRALNDRFVLLNNTIL